MICWKAQMQTENKVKFSNIYYINIFTLAIKINKSKKLLEHQALQ